MHDTAHPRIEARLRESARQLHVHAVERGVVAVQDRDQVDDGIAAAQQLCEACVVMDVGVD